MNEAAGHFARRVLLRQAFAGITAFAALALLAPQLLLIEPAVAPRVLAHGVVVALAAGGVTAVLTLLLLRKSRFALRSLALGSRAIEPDELEALAAVPSAATARWLVASAVLSASVLVPGLRPDRLDGGRAASLVFLAVTILGAAAIPHYVLLRETTLRIVEMAPLEPISTLLEGEELLLLPGRRVVGRMLMAIGAPVALVGVGAVLIAHAHIRTFLEQSRRETAMLLARSALEPSAFGLNDPGRADAIAAAAEFGFLAHLDPKSSVETVVTREADGQIAVTTPIEDGTAQVRFSAELDPALVASGAMGALVAVLVAAALGLLVGRALAGDLSLATRRVRLLGTETVLRGATELALPARFAVVGRLLRAVEVLADRFRVFAAAQERALEARDKAQRLRGLLFASVSHDLKSPLNAILGFTDLVGREPLSDSQRESLELIETRGRELLALIETILDAARVEAGQLALLRRPTEIPALIAEAVRKARELAGDAPAEVVVEVARGLPPVPVDAAHITRAISVIIAHALRVAQSPGARPVRVRATRQASTDDPSLTSWRPPPPGGAGPSSDPARAPASRRSGPPRSSDGGAKPAAEEHVDGILVDIEHGSSDVGATELDALFARQASSRGRGLTLGLSLARSVIELHGGALVVDRAADGSPIARCAIPFAPPPVSSKGKGARPPR